ncbi:hypothetical protein V8C86DRAFT_2819835 [Haematococcus lacustris]
MGFVASPTRHRGQLGLCPDWPVWGPYCGLLVNWCKGLGVRVANAFVAFNLDDRQLKWHKDSGDVDVGRVVVNLGGGGVVNLRCGGEKQCHWLPHGWAYFMGPVASGKLPVRPGLYCQHSVGIQPGFSQPWSRTVGTCSLIIDVNITSWNVSAPPSPSPLPFPLFPSFIWRHLSWFILRESLPISRRFQAQMLKAARTTRRAWKDKAARKAAGHPPTLRDKQLHAKVVKAGRARAVAYKLGVLGNESGLVGYLDTLPGLIGA